MRSICLVLAVTSPTSSSRTPRQRAARSHQRASRGEGPCVWLFPNGYTISKSALMRFRRIISLSRVPNPLRAVRGKRGIFQVLLFAPAQDKWPPSPPLHAFVNLLPEAPEIIHGGDDRNGSHEPDGHLRHQINVKDETEEAQIEVPAVPADGQHGRHHRDNLYHHLQLAQLARLNREPFRSGNRTQPGNKELPSDDQHHDPYIHDIRHQSQQSDVACSDHQLVRSEE